MDGLCLDMLPRYSLVHELQFYIRINICEVCEAYKMIFSLKLYTIYYWYKSMLHNPIYLMLTQFFGCINSYGAEDRIFKEN